MNKSICCKTCRHWDRDIAKDKVGRIQSNRVAQCLFPLPEFPASIELSGNRLGMKLRWMAADYGQKCKTHEIYTKEMADLCQSVGSLEKIVNKHKRTISGLTVNEKELEILFEKKSAALKCLDDEILDTKKAIAEITTKISVAQDRLRGLNQAGDSTTISKDEQR